MLVSFIIPALNESQLIGRCLQSIRAQQLPSPITDFEIIVVDTGSTDQTIQIAENLGAAIVRTPLKTTIAAARNKGAKASKGEFLAFLDADCELRPGWLSIAAEHFKNETVVAVGTILAPPPSNASWVERLWHRLGYQQPRSTYIKVDWLPTLNILVSRQHFYAAGEFNESLTTCEDQDFGERLQLQGDIILESRAPARHLRESKTLYELFRREIWRGKNNFKSMLLSRHPMREIPSVLIPVLFVILTLGMSISIGMSFISKAYIGSAFVSAMAVLAMPIGFLLRRRVPIQPMFEYIQCHIISMVYLFARGIAAFAFLTKRYTSS